MKAQEPREAHIAHTHADSMSERPDIAGPRVPSQSNRSSIVTLPGQQSNTNISVQRLRSAASTTTSLPQNTASPALLNTLAGPNASGTSGLVIGASGSVVQAPARLSRIYDASLQRRPQECSLSALALLYSEAVLYMQRQSQGVKELESRLSKLGKSVGKRVLELHYLREGRSARRETTILGVLHLVHTSIWQMLFGKPADALEKSNDKQNEYMLIDNNPTITEFISVPRDRSQLNCAAFAAGLIEAILCGSKFDAEVGAHSVPTAQFPYRTVFLVKFQVMGGAKV